MPCLWGLNSTSAFYPNQGVQNYSITVKLYHNHFTESLWFTFVSLFQLRDGTKQSEILFDYCVPSEREGWHHFTSSCYTMIMNKNECNVLRSRWPSYVRSKYTAVLRKNLVSAYHDQMDICDFLSELGKELLSYVPVKIWERHAILSKVIKRNIFMPFAAKHKNVRF